MLASIANFFHIKTESSDDVIDESEDVLLEAGKQAAEIDKQLRQVESEIENFEEREKDIRREGECVIMATHDEGSEKIGDDIRAMVLKELNKVSTTLSKKREDLELRVIKLHIKRAEVLGEQRKAEQLLYNCGRTMDPEVAVVDDSSSEETDVDEQNPLVS